MLHHMLRAAAQRAFSTLDPYFKYVTMLLHGDGSAAGSTTVTPFNSDASTNAFNVTINGDARSNNFNPYQAGYYSNYFDGTGDFLTVPSTSGQLGAGDFTVEAWVFPISRVNSFPTIFGNYSGYGAGSFAIFAGHNGGNTSKYQVAINGASFPTIQSTDSIVYGQWTHVAAVRSGTTITLYLNGVANGTYSTSATLNGANTTWIGTAGDELVNGCFNGYISNLRVVKGTAVYTSAFTPPTAPLTAITNTSLLTCQSNRFIDNSTNAFTITNNGGAAVFYLQPFTLPTTVATYGSGYFDGTGDYLSVPTNAAFQFGSGNFTIECWAYMAGAAQQFLISQWNTPNKSWALLLRNTGTTLSFVYSTNGSNETSIDATIAAQNGRWTHFAAVRNGNTLTLYMNGVSVGSGSVTGVTLYSATQAIDIGRNTEAPGTWNFTGYMTDARVVKGTAVYTSAFTPPTAPLTAITNTQLLTTQYNGAGNNNGFKDSSQNNFVITRNGNTTQGTFSPYGANWSNYFNGSSGVTVSSTSSQFGFSGDFTWEAWVNLASLPSSGGNYSIICSRGSVASNSAFQFLVGNSSGTYQITGTISISSSDSNLIWNIPTAPSVGTWYHVAIVRSGSSVQAYWNGAAIGSAQTASGTTNTPTVNPSIGFRGGSYNDLFFNGYISNLRMVGSAVYTSNFTPSTTPLTAISGTRILTCADNRFIDDSTNAFTLTAYSSPSVQRFSPFSPTSAYSTSVIGGSGYFDGSGDYLTAPDSPAIAFGSGDLTIECWCYSLVTTGGADQIILGKYTGSFGSSSFSMGQNNTTLTMGFYTGGSSYFIMTSSVALQGRVWNHIAVTRSGNSWYMFLNGVQVANTTQSVTIISNTTPLYVGGEPYYNQMFTGYISNLRIVKGTALYTSAFTPPTAPLTATANTSVLLSYTNAGVLDNAMMNDLETVGNAQISTSVKKYGAGSIYLDGTGDYLNCANPASVIHQLGTGDFTVEFWAYLTNSGNDNGPIFDTRTTSSNGLLIRQGNGAGGISNRIDAVIGGSATASSGTISFNTWVFVAVVRNSGTLKVYYNGTGGTGVTATGNITGTNAYIGAFYDGLSVNIAGYFDDFRITKGVARYTSNFTPPAAAFPNN